MNVSAHATALVHQRLSTARLPDCSGPWHGRQQPHDGAASRRNGTDRGSLLKMQVADTGDSIFDNEHAVVTDAGI